jgi:hypothetical protein
MICVGYAFAHVTAETSGSSIASAYFVNLSTKVSTYLFLLLDRGGVQQRPYGRLETLKKVL